ncbi:OmpA family protein [Cyclobacterium sp. SYSU L10401]|uniref:OmpA family protein n=1 Tax=Cyclobacterium sp. SYSU L10401 TaxID=2678657 RepID=UPI0013D0E957|nr:OmpA family protein [Cyclobacterium sp. SYSU L10401]
MERKMTYITKASAIMALACWFYLPLPAQDSMAVNQVFSLDYDEHQPIMGPDGKLFFTLAYHPDNQNGINDPGDIWYAAEKTGGFDSPRRLPQLSTPYYDLLIGFIHPDTLLVYHQNLQNRQVIQSYYRTGSEWLRGEAQDLPGFKINGDHFSARLHAGGSLMVMSMDSFGTYGNEDIYVAFRQGKAWSRPLNLGAAINTSQQELSPFLSADTRTLYFSTNARGGEKSMGVYFSQREGEGWNEWSLPRRLNLPAMEGFDLYYFPDPTGERAFFTNTQTSDGYGNILLLGDFKAEALVAEVDEVLPAVVEEAEMPDLSREKDETETETAVQDAEPMENRVSFDQLDRGEAVILDQLLFQRGSSILADSAGMAQLEDLATYLLSRPETVISVDGHTDNYGSARLNERLSLERAQMIRDFLVEKGVDFEQIRVNGWGGRRPIATNRNAAGREKNRRVEINVLNQP